MTAKEPNLVIYRQQEGTAAVFFIHGFTGDATGTWGDFPALLAADPELSEYDVFSWGYPTQLNLAYTITRHFWTDDPDIETIGMGLRTLLANFAQNYQKLVLVGHSMGGLVIQSFILEELLRDGHEHLDKLTEVVLYGTPSGGLKKASLGAFLKNQIADMNFYGDFIQKLRSEWKQQLDDCRASSALQRSFRLTLVAGMKDNFVPPESSLNPFPLDEKEIVPGDHTSMVKPSPGNDLAFRVLKKRLLRGALTAQEKALITGEDQRVIDRVNRIRAAEELGDVDALKLLANEMLQPGTQHMPLVDRALGLALSDHEQFQPAARLLQRYLDFQLPVDGRRPFQADVQVLQQLAVTLSGAGDITGALARLNDLDPQVRGQSESMGLRAGRIKRQWLKNPQLQAVGQRALMTYKTAFELAIAADDRDQQIFNGINYAYMSFALKKNNWRELAERILGLCQNCSEPDYWTDATQAEAQLLLGRYTEAATAYEQAFCHAPVPRYLSTTGYQALDIIARQGHPEESQCVDAVIDQYIPFVRDQAAAPENPFA